MTSTLEPARKEAPGFCTVFKHYTFHNYVFSAVITPFFIISNLCNSLLRCCGAKYIPSLNDDVNDVAAREKRVKRQKLWALILWPFKPILFLVFLALLFPLTLLGAAFSALWRRLVAGGPWETIGKQTPFGVHPDYPCQLVFKKAFEPAKLTQLFYEMCTEAGVPSSMANIEFPEVEPSHFPAANEGSEVNHYIKTGNRNFVAAGYSKYATRIIGLHCYNGVEGSPTVWHSYMPGCTWDGTSCFNFNKELVNRYYSGEKGEVFMKKDGLKLGDEAKAKLQKNTNFCGFLCRLPLTLLVNTSVLLWNVLGAMPFCGGPGFSFEYADDGRF